MVIVPVRARNAVGKGWWGSDLEHFNANWDRCVHVDDEITEDMVRRLTPRILQLRQESDKPITIAINSPGGSVAAADTLLALITGPNQDGIGCRAITDAVQEASSPAAVMLAKGDY